MSKNLQEGKPRSQSHLNKSKPNSNSNCKSQATVRDPLRSWAPPKGLGHTFGSALRLCAHSKSPRTLRLAHSTPAGSGLLLVRGNSWLQLTGQRIALSAHKRPDTAFASLRILTARSPSSPLLSTLSTFQAPPEQLTELSTASGFPSTKWQSVSTILQKHMVRSVTAGTH